MSAMQLAAAMQSCLLVMCCQARGGFDGFYTYFASDGFVFGSSRANWPSMVDFANKNGMLSSLSVGPGMFFDSNEYCAPIDCSCCQVILMGAFDLGISATLKKERTGIIIENHGMQQQHYLLHLFQSRAGMNGMRVLRLKTACAFTAWRPCPQKRPLFVHFSHNSEIHLSSVLPGQRFLQTRNPNGRT